MRYTTLIDITEQPDVYRNVHARLLYLHLALKSGYHDNDRDLIAISIRRLAMDAGLTVSATRHALRVLGDAGLITREGDKLRVLKWIAAPMPTPRPTQKEARRSASANVGDLVDRAEREAADYERKVLAAIRSCTKEQLQQWADELDNNKRVRHCGVMIAPTLDNAKWFRETIAKL